MSVEYKKIFYASTAEKVRSVFDKIDGILQLT